MKVNVKSSYVVKPSEPTWSGLLSLSVLDQIGTMMHVETLYFYTTPSTSPDAIIHTLRISLSQVLVHFYPLAGRLSWTTAAAGGSTLALNCNATGVLLLEAESDAVLANLGDFSPGPDFKHLVPSVDYNDYPIQDIPLFAGQLTKFRCGGISLGFAISHVVADGQGLCHFLLEWANLASGQPLSSAPFHDRRVLRAGESSSSSSSPQGGRRVFHHSPPLIVGQSSDESERMKETKVSTLRLSKPQIHALKAAANNGRSCNGKPPPGYTRYEVITAHIWRCACKARSHKPQQPTNLCFCVDIRRRMEPPLPDSYFGNAIIDVVIHGVSGEIISRPLEDVACKIRKAIDSVTSEYVNCAIDFYRNEGDVIKRQQELGPLFAGNPNLSVISWVGLPIQGLDFGWGEEIHMSPGNHDCDGDVLILPDSGIDGDGEGSLLVAACFQVDHIQDFNQYFYFL